VARPPKAAGGVFCGELILWPLYHERIAMNEEFCSKRLPWAWPLYGV